MLHRNCLCLVIMAVLGCSQAGGPVAEGPAASPVPAAVWQVSPTAETPPVETADDAADDPAIWVHPQDPSKSVVIGTNKQRGLLVYDLDGSLLQTLPDGRMNNVDLRDGFVVDGREMSLVAASNRSDQSIEVYLLDPETRRLTRAAPPIPTGLTEPYGLCMYVSPDGNHHVFVNNAGDGRFRQWRIRSEGGRIVAERLREFLVGSQAEGCVADDETGALYVAQEDGAFWKYSAAADGGDKRLEIDRVGGKNGLVADIEGVSIWQGRDGRGYVVLSNQGANSYAVYRREGDNDFVGLFRIVDDAERGIDGVSETDGLAVTSRFLSPQYPEGLLVVQDGSNLPSGQHQNFKYVSWRDVAQNLDIAGGK